MKLKSLDTGNILKIFLWAAIILSLSIFVTTLIYSLWYDFYLKIELVDMFLESVFSILIIMLIIIYLVWIYKAHQDLNELISHYPISPWGAIRRITIPFYNIYGQWAIYSTMKRYVTDINGTKKLEVMLTVTIPLYYFLHWSSNIFDSFIKRTFAIELLGEQFFNYLAASYGLNAVVFTSYLFMLLFVTKFIQLLSADRIEISESEITKDTSNLENAPPSLPEYSFLSDSPIINQTIGIKPIPLKIFHSTVWVGLGLLTTSLLLKFFILFVVGTPNSIYGNFRNGFLREYVADPTVSSIPYSIGLLLPNFALLLVCYLLLLLFIHKKLFKSLLITVLLFGFFSLSSMSFIQIFCAIALTITFFIGFGRIRTYMKTPLYVQI